MGGGVVVLRGGEGQHWCAKVHHRARGRTSHCVGNGWGIEERPGPHPGLGSMWGDRGYGYGANGTHVSRPTLTPPLGSMDACKESVRPTGGPTVPAVSPSAPTPQLAVGPRGGVGQQNLSAKRIFERTQTIHSLKERVARYEHCTVAVLPVGDLENFPPLLRPKSLTLSLKLFLCVLLGPCGTLFWLQFEGALFWCGTHICWYGSS